VVDDQEDVLNTLMRFLSAAEYATVGTTRFEEAKRYIDQSPPDVLVTDVRLGPDNGLHLALRMRAANPAASIVVLSAWDDVLLRQEAAAVGAQYHTKPLGKQQLIEAIKAGEPRL
jgi:DNA-binding response OmpR family regulator